MTPAPVVPRAFETLKIGEAGIDGTTWDLRLVRERAEPGAYFVVSAGDMQGPFGSVVDAVAHSTATFPEVTWRGSLGLGPEDGPCPVCRAPLRRLERLARYPRALCPVCVLEAVDRDGLGLRFCNASAGGGFEARRADGLRGGEHVCYVRGIPCWADEGYFGGVVVQRVDGSAEAPPPSIRDRVAGRRLRAGVHVAEEERLVAERIFDPGAEVTLGGDADAALVVPGWVGPTLRLITDGVLLHLGPGMRMHVCHDQGEDRVLGTFEELSANGITFPLRLTVSKLNIKVREGVTVFAKYLAEGESR